MNKLSKERCLKDLSRLSLLFIDIFFPWIFGYFIGHSRFKSDNLCKHLLTFNMVVFWPVINIFSMWVLKLDIALLWLPVLGLISYLAPGLVGWVMSKRRYSNPLDQGSYLLAAIMPNNITIGMIAAFILYGEQGVAISQMMSAVAVPISFLICYPLAEYYAHLGKVEGAKRPTVWNLIVSKNQLPLIGLIFGLCLNFSGISRPEVFGDVVAVFVHVSAWAFLFPVGHSMELRELPQHLRAAWDLLAYKFIVAPVAVGILAYYVLHDSVAIGTAIVVGGTPVAILAVVLSQLSRLNYHVAMAGVLMSHVVYVFVIFPLLIFLQH